VFWSLRDISLPPRKSAPLRHFLSEIAPGGAKLVHA
jgi:hypothetical protein